MLKEDFFDGSFQPKINASILSENVLWNPGGFVAVTVQDTAPLSIRIAKKRIDCVHLQIRV